MPKPSRDFKARLRQMVEEGECLTSPADQLKVLARIVEMNVEGTRIEERVAGATVVRLNTGNHSDAMRALEMIRAIVAPILAESDSFVPLPQLELPGHLRPQWPSEEEALEPVLEPISDNPDASPSPAPSLQFPIPV